jgi:hypothetical protein
MYLQITKKRLGPQISNSQSTTYICGRFANLTNFLWPPIKGFAICETNLQINSPPLKINNKYQINNKKRVKNMFFKIVRIISLQQKVRHDLETPVLCLFDIFDYFLNLTSDFMAKL